MVAVPDFSTPARSVVFEARTLFFLASWLENAGAARALPLHLACIGEPPSSVRRLAERCGARVRVCELMSLAGSLTANKLRGLETPVEFERLLMLDTDVFILGDFSTLVTEVPLGIAAAPVGSKWVPEALWQRIYRQLEMPLPEERAPMLQVECGLQTAAQARHQEFGQTTDLTQMLPHYNSGVILAPYACGLRELWADHLVRIAELFTPELVQRELRETSASRGPLWRKVSRTARKSWERFTTRRAKYPRSVRACDQASLSTAIQLLRARGVPFHRLSDAYHARSLHCQAGRLRLDDMKIYHATGFLRPEKRGSWNLDHVVEQGIRHWQESFRAGARFREHPAEAEEDARRAGDFVRRLHREYVRPALG